MALSSTTIKNIADKADRPESQLKMQTLASQIRAANSAKKFGSSPLSQNFGESLAASLCDPLFWKKVDILLRFPFK